MPYDKIYMIALGLLYKGQPRKVREMISHYASAQEAWERAEHERKSECLAAAQREMDFVAQHQIEFFDYREDNYPARLKECPDAPVLLFGKGNLHPNSGKFLSVVGTRRATNMGKELTRQLILDLAQLVPDLTIVSGLAYGIDVAAHRAALEAGLPTIVVPAHGLDRVYPSVHRQVAVQALEKGGILTEYPSGTEPEKMNFVARNRIVAGLSDATLVVESPARGGSLITANMSRDYDREVMAVPGRPQDIYSQGCNALIRDQKASLVGSAEDIANVMNWAMQKSPFDSQLQMPLDECSDEEQVLMRLLDGEDNGVHINELVMQSAMPYSDVASLLMMLELKQKVKSLPGGRYMKRINQ